MQHGNIAEKNITFLGMPTGKTFNINIQLCENRQKKLATLVAQQLYHYCEHLQIYANRNNRHIKLVQTTKQGTR